MTDVEAVVLAGTARAVPGALQTPLKPSPPPANSREDRRHEADNIDRLMDWPGGRSH